MIVEKILVNGVKAVETWITTANKMRDIMIYKQWDTENTLKIYSFENVDAVIERGKDSLIKTDIEVGSLVDSVVIEDKVIYFDNPYWTLRFGKSCLFNNDAKPHQLFCTGKRENIHPKYTEGMLITQLAAKRVFIELNIPVEFFTDADVYLLPSRDKFACGWSRAMYKNDDKKQSDMVRHEGGWFTYYADHDLFQRVLPTAEYNREDSHDPNHAGIDGIENKYPNFDREDFILKWTEEISKIIKDPITETKEISYS